jgi:hypothetical protein
VPETNVDLARCELFEYQESAISPFHEVLERRHLMLGRPAKNELPEAHLARAHLCPRPALRRRDRAGTDEEILLAPRVLSSGASSQPSPPGPPAERAGCGLHRGVRDRRIQLPHSWVSRLTEELDAEIVERQAVASERRVVLTKTLTKARR